LARRRPVRTPVASGFRQQPRRHASGAHGVRRGHQVLQVGAEIGVGEVAVAGTEAGEVEAQRRDAAVARPTAMRLAATTSFPQVKQCANGAVASGGPSGKSSRAARFCPSAR